MNIYWKKDEPSVKHTGCDFVGLIPKTKAKKGSSTVKERVFVCMRSKCGREPAVFSYSSSSRVDSCVSDQSLSVQFS